METEEVGEMRTGRGHAPTTREEVGSLKVKGERHHPLAMPGLGASPPHWEEPSSPSS